MANRACCAACSGPLHWSPTVCASPGLLRRVAARRRELQRTDQRLMFDWCDTALMYRVQAARQEPYLAFFIWSLRLRLLHGGRRQAGRTLVKCVCCLATSTERMCRFRKNRSFGKQVTVDENNMFQYQHSFTQRMCMVKL